MDMINDLPDEIIIKILSFLSIYEAASTSILSKRWRDLFAFTPNLHLSLTCGQEEQLRYVASYRQNFIDFVERVLAVSGNSAITSFTLQGHLRVLGSSHLDRWIGDVLKRGVLDLHIEIFGIFHEAVPVFKNLYHLSITTLGEDLCLSASSLPSLMKKCPNLQTLVIKGPLCCHDESKHVCPCFSENSCILSSPVKVLKLTKYKGSIKELGKIKLFLEELSCLELVKVCTSAKDEKEKSRITKDLLMLPTASSKCKMHIQFS